MDSTARLESTQALATLREAIGDWLAFAPARVRGATVFLGDATGALTTRRFQVAGSRPRSEPMPTQTEARARLLAAVERYAAAAAPESVGFVAMRRTAAGSLGMLHGKIVSEGDRGPVAASVVEWKEATYRETSDAWPVARDGTLGRRRTFRGGLTSRTCPIDQAALVLAVQRGERSDD